MNNFSSVGSSTEDNIALWTDVASFTDYPEYKVTQMIWKIWPPLILLVGGFGNIATFFVMLRVKDHNSSQYVILMVLAISDFTLLVSNAVDWWLKILFNVHVRILHEAGCKLVFWVIYFSNTTSAWLVTCVTLQRTMAVLWPHRMRVMCTVRRTWIVIVTLILTAFALDFHLLVGMEISKENVCVPAQGVYEQFKSFFFSWLDSCLTSIIPSVCLFVCDIILSITLFKAVSSSSIAAHTDSNVSGVHKTDNRKKISLRTTVMVLAISCAFLVLTTPVCVYLIWVPYADAYLQQHPRSKAMAKLIRAVTFQMWYSNSAINFFLYILTGTKFRREFMNWIRCGGARSPSAPSVHETASEASRG